MYSRIVLFGCLLLCGCILVFGDDLNEKEKDELMECFKQKGYDFNEEEKQAKDCFSKVLDSSTKKVTDDSCKKIQSGQFPCTDQDFYTHVKECGKDKISELNQIVGQFKELCEEQ